MKKLSILILILICFTQCISSPDNKTSLDNTVSKTKNSKSVVTRDNNSNNHIASEKESIDSQKIYAIDSVQVKPEFEGGIERFQKYIRYNYKYYEEEIPVKGVVEVNFIVEKDGKLSTINVVKDIGFGTGDEAIRVLKKAPKWIPGTHNNKLVRVLFHLSIPMDNSYNHFD
ncbi:energy transducer TonB [Flavobacterium ginsengiterrae]|uniref:TonB C-terminal domain-containing protein n=1 Tax=Flavobacterium ginsengiterrae TaxID=871695 RepID=A0ABP7GV89_9FLAO